MSTEQMNIPIDCIHPNESQPRKHFEGIETLADSLCEHGQLSAILVRPIGDGYELVHGERRWRAAKLAGLDSLRAEVRQLDDAEAYRLSVIENVQRQDLTAIEEAESYRVLLDSGMTQIAIGRLVGKSQSYVAHKMRLLNAPEPIRLLSALNALSEGHIRQILRFEKLYPLAAALEWGSDQPALPAVSTVEELANAYNELRPEDNPPTPLWMFDFERLTTCDRLSALVASGQAMFEYVTNHKGSPQWIVSSWWWGAAAIVYDLSVADLAKQIDNWLERYHAAVTYLTIHPNCPTGNGESSLIWWGYRSDLRHGGSSGDKFNDRSFSDFWFSRECSNSPPLSTSFQPWGTQAKRGAAMSAAIL